MSCHFLLVLWVGIVGVVAVGRGATVVGSPTVPVEEVASAPEITKLPNEDAVLEDAVAVLVPEAPVSHEEALEDAVKDPAAGEDDPLDLQCVTSGLSSSSKDANPPSDADICRSVSLECLSDSLQKLLEDPVREVSGKDHACILLNLLQRNQDYIQTITTLETALTRTTENLNTLQSQLDSHHAPQLTKRLSTLEESTESRLYNLETALSKLENHTHSMETSLTQEHMTIKSQISSSQSQLSKFQDQFNMTAATASSQALAFEAALSDLHDIGVRWDGVRSDVSELKSSSKTLEESVESLSNRVADLSSSVDRESTRVTLASKELKDSVIEGITLVRGQIETDFLRRLDGQKTMFSNMVQEQVGTLKGHVQKDLENATLNVKEMLQVPFTLIDKLDNKVSGRIEGEVQRAQSVEKRLSELYLNGTLAQRGLSEDLKREQGRALGVESALKSVLEGQKKKLEELEKDFSSQIRVESLRAKGAEAELSLILERHAEKGSKVHGEMQGQVDKLGVVLVEEEKRALSAEKSLEKLISEEASRATTAESGLLKNINEELRRASGREDDLHKMCVWNGDAIKGNEEALSVVKTDLENEIAQREEILNINANYLGEHKRRVAELESRVTTKVGEERERAESVEKSISDQIQTVLKRTAESESFLKREVGQGKLILERVGGAMVGYEGAVTDLGDRFSALEGHLKGDLKTVGEKMDSLKVDEKIGNVIALTQELQANFTGHLLALAEETDGKFGEVRGELGGRVGRVEGEVKELKSKMSGSGGGGVFNRLVGMFGGGRPGGNKRKVKQATAVAAGGDSSDKRERLRVEDVFENDDGDDKGNVKESRSLPLVIQRSNSRVREVYG